VYDIRRTVSAFFEFSFVLQRYLMPPVGKICCKIGLQLASCWHVASLLLQRILADC